eukprot:scaffold4107_cov95-Isochrysis_galbana.AAC.5
MACPCPRKELRATGATVVRARVRAVLPQSALETASPSPAGQWRVRTGGVDQPWTVPSAGVEKPREAGQPNVPGREEGGAVRLGGVRGVAGRQNHLGAVEGRDGGGGAKRSKGEQGGWGPAAGGRLALGRRLTVLDPRAHLLLIEARDSHLDDVQEQPQRQQRPQVLLVEAGLEQLKMRLPRHGTLLAAAVNGALDALEQLLRPLRPRHLHHALSVACVVQWVEEVERQLPPHSERVLLRREVEGHPLAQRPIELGPERVQDEVHLVQHQHAAVQDAHHLAAHLHLWAARAGARQGRAAGRASATRDQRDGPRGVPRLGGLGERHVARRRCDARIAGRVLAAEECAHAHERWPALARLGPLEITSQVVVELVHEVDEGERERLDRGRGGADQPATALGVAELVHKGGCRYGGTVKGEGVDGLGHEGGEALAQHRPRECEQGGGDDLDDELRAVGQEER